MKDKLMEEVDLLRRVKKFIEDSYEIELDTLRIEIDDTGRLRVFSGNTLADGYLLGLNLNKEELTYDDIVSCIEGDYDHEIREYLFSEIEKNNDEIPTDELKRLAGV